MHLGLLLEWEVYFLLGIENTFIRKGGVLAIMNSAFIRKEHILMAAHYIYKKENVFARKGSFLSARARHCIYYKGKCPCY